MLISIVNLIVKPSNKRLNKEIQNQIIEILLNEAWEMMISIYRYHKYIRLLVIFYHGSNIIFDIVGLCILLQNFNGSWASLDYNVISSKPILIYMQAQKDVLHFIFLHAISKRDNVFNIVQCYCILRIFLLKNSIYLTAQLFK